MPLVRIRPSTLVVLRTLLDLPPGSEIHGWALVKTTGLVSGTVYPLLERLEDQGWLTSRWDLSTDAHGTPRRRRLYRFVDAHRAEALALLEKHGAARTRQLRKVDHDTH